MAAINTDGVFAAATSELTIDIANITVSKRFHTIAAGTGTDGTIQNVILDSGIGTQIGANITEVFLRPKAGHFISVQHAVGATAPIYMLGSQTMNLNDTQTLHLVRNFGSNSWIGVNGITLPTGNLVGLTDVQNLTNKTITGGTLVAPRITGTFTHDGISSGFSGSERIFGQVGSQVVGAVTGTATAITLAEERSMKIHARVLIAASDHTAAVTTEVTGLFRRALAGNIVMVGTTTPVTIGTTAVSVTFGADTAAQAANLLFTGIAGTYNFVAEYEYSKLALNT